jgi:hypothetical protein
MKSKNQIQIRIRNTTESGRRYKGPDIVAGSVSLPRAVNVYLTISSLQVFYDLLFVIDAVQEPMDMAFDICGLNLEFGTDAPAAALASFRCFRRSNSQESSKFVRFDVISRDEQHRTCLLASRVIASI